MFELAIELDKIERGETIEQGVLCLHLRLNVVPSSCEERRNATKHSVSATQDNSSNQQQPVLQSGEHPVCTRVFQVTIAQTKEDGTSHTTNSICCLIVASISKSDLLRAAKHLVSLTRTNNSVHIAKPYARRQAL